MVGLHLGLLPNMSGLFVQAALCAASPSDAIPHGGACAHEADRPRQTRESRRDVPSGSRVA